MATSWAWKTVLLILVLRACGLGGGPGGPPSDPKRPAGTADLPPTPQDATSQPENSRELWDRTTRNDGADPPGSAAPRFAAPTDWDTLASEILPRFFDLNGATAVMALLREARCTIDISIDAGAAPPVRGALTYAWTDTDQDGLLSPDEVHVTISNGDAQALEPYRKQFEMQALCNTVRMLLRSRVTAARQGEGYLVTIAPGPQNDALEALGLTAMKCTVSPELCLTEMTVTNAQGQESFSRFRYEKLNGKWFATQSTRRTARPGAGLVQETAESVYTALEGVTLHQRMTIDTEALAPSGESVAHLRQEFGFRDWQIVKRPQPLGPPRPGAAVAKTAPPPPSPTPARTDSTENPPTPRNHPPAPPPATNTLSVAGMEKYVSPEARFVAYKPKDWQVQEAAQQGYLIIAITDPRGEYTTQLACGLNPFGEDPVAIVRALVANARNQYPDYQLTNAYGSADKRTMVFDSHYTDPTRGPREGRSWVAVSSDSFTLARCETPGGRFEAGRRVLLTILMNIGIMRNTIPDAPKLLPLAPYRLSDGSASFSLPQGWALERDSGTGFFTAKDRSGLGSFAVASVEVITPQLGVTVPGVPVLPYLSPHEALAALAQFQGILRDVRFIEVNPRPDVANMIGQVYTAGPVQVEECLSTYVLNGTRCKAYTFGISFGSRLGTNWRFNHMSVGAPEAEFDALVPTLVAMMGSYKISDEFAQRYIAEGMARLRRMQQETAAIIAKNRQEISSMMQAAYDERQRSQDWIDYQRTNYIRGQSDWISNMEGGAVYHSDSWGTQNTVTGEHWEGSPFNYVNFEGNNPKYNESMTPIDNRRLFEQVFRGQ